MAFTREIDDAIARYELDDGTEIALATDMDADDPFDMGDTWKHTAIGVHDGQLRWHGDSSLFDASPDNDTYVIELTHHVVVIGPEFWETMGIEKSDDRAVKEAKALADEFMEWDQGGVVVMAVTWPDGEEEQMGNIYGLNPHDRQDVIDAAHEMFDIPKE